MADDRRCSQSRSWLLLVRSRRSEFQPTWEPPISSRSASVPSLSRSLLTPLLSPALLTAAGSILTLEARHQSILNTFNGGSFAPQAFDIALSPQQVLALAGGFLENCNAGQLGLTSNKPLSITDSSSRSTRFRIGSQLSFASSVTLDLNVSPISCSLHFDANNLSCAEPLLPDARGRSPRRARLQLWIVHRPAWHRRRRRRLPHKQQHSPPVEPDHSGRQHHRRRTRVSPIVVD